MKFYIGDKEVGSLTIGDKVAVEGVGVLFKPYAFDYGSEKKGDAIIERKVPSAAAWERNLPFVNETMKRLEIVMR
jgi:hypothetical protein